MTFRKYLILLAISMLSTVVGCGSPSAQFTQNKVGSRVAELQGGVDEGMSRQLYQQISDIMAAMFGTPDEPHFIANGAEAGFIDVDNLVLASGPVANGRLSGDADGDPHMAKGQGLYRQHCVHCHGITGDGKGPTAAFLNPYPRDFTMGKFKFNSTRIGVPSTDDDLHQILMKGINGTAMPSFALLDRGEVEALVDYVKYLSARGQMERLLFERATEVSGEDDEQITTDPSELIGDADGDGLGAIVDSWKTSEPAVMPDEPNVPIVSENPANWNDDEKTAVFASIDRGRELYYTAKANCYSCHGPTQLGDGNLGLYDDWTKELHNWQSVTDEDGSKKAEFMELGGLEPRIIRPRNLRLGQYRGGRRPLDIFWRVHNGIDGAGMPAANGLTHDEIWDIVNYVLWLPYEQLSHPSVELQTLDRARD